MKVQRLANINIFIIILVFIGNYFYQNMGFSYPLKIFCSSGFAVMGCINMFYAYKKMLGKKIAFLMTFGLIFAFLGDVAINPNFILGVVFFALGHVFFVVSYLTYKKINKLDLVLSIVLAVFSIGFILFFPYIVFDIPALRYVVLVYASIISVMVGKAVGNSMHEKTCFTMMVAMGSILFFISDMMLLLAWFSTIEGRWTSHVCMAAYYPALCLLASSMVIYERECLIARIIRMETYFDRVQDVLNEQELSLFKDLEVKKAVHELNMYQESGQWLIDYESDERGDLPFGMKRGVLSQDGLYNLLIEVEKVYPHEDVYEA